jgi:hypothetical protein
MDNINFRFLSSIYRKIKNIRLKVLNEQVQKLKLQIEDEKMQLQDEEAHLEKLLQKNSIIKDKYTKGEELFQSQNKIIAIKNNNYRIERWDNVFIKKQSSSYVILTKRQEEIYHFDENLKDFLDYLLTLEHSVIVLSVDKSRISLQIRLN